MLQNVDLDACTELYHTAYRIARYATRYGACPVRVFVPYRADAVRYSTILAQNALVRSVAWPEYVPYRAPCRTLRYGLRTGWSVPNGVRYGEYQYDRKYGTVCRVSI